MDPSRFDALARSLTTPASRRSALAGLVAGIFAPFVSNPDAEAKRRGRRGQAGNPRSEAHRDSSDRVGAEKKKRTRKKKKNPTQPCTANCSGGKNCGSDGCAGTCGTCSVAGQACGGGGTPGVCGCTPISACPLGQNCGTVSDGCGGTVSCGTCSVAGQTCGGGGTPGVCGGSCTTKCGSPHYRNCGDDGCGGSSCGDCTRFGGGGICNSNGHCTCREGYWGCGAYCADILTDEKHCGGCGRSCNDPRQICCNGACHDPLYSAGACGGCGLTCPEGHATCCEGECVNLLDNPAHCGICRIYGGECPQGLGCFGGRCR